ncbi:MAG: glutaredoxin 2 [Bdellovibrionaceae bacterium]|nr:glutaredoxin 2 [Pseudobdellovibrionaceae bacterium]
MKLYYYDHCPYCVKARMIFGLKNVPVELEALDNDDEKTPIDLIGQKMVPILIKEDKTPMPESLDIIKFIDENYGEKRIVTYDSPRPEIAQWLQGSRQYTYHLAMPRWTQMPLPEFQTESARQYFQTKKEKQSIGPFTEALKNTNTYIELATKSLTQLESFMDNNANLYNLGEQVHIDDFHVFSTLRSLTAVSDLNFPKKVSQYTQRMADRSKIDLYIDRAL